MKENDYIAATNLAKLRVALSVLKDVLPMGAADEKHVGDAMRTISFLVDKYEAQIKD